jgi:rare lipoprotein A
MLKQVAPRFIAAVAPPAASEPGLPPAHRTLTFDTMVRVTNIRNRKTVVVRITDRGPYGRVRIIDLTRAAAREPDMISSGTALVSVERQ